MIQAAKAISEYLPAKTIPEELKRVSKEFIEKVYDQFWTNPSTQPHDFYFLLKIWRILRVEINFDELRAKIIGSGIWKRWAIEYRCWDEIFFILRLKTKAKLDEIIYFVELKLGSVGKEAPSF